MFQGVNRVLTLRQMAGLSGFPRVSGFADALRAVQLVIRAA